MSVDPKESFFDLPVPNISDSSSLQRQQTLINLTITDLIQQEALQQIFNKYWFLVVSLQYKDF